MKKNDKKFTIILISIFLLLIEVDCNAMVNFEPHLVLRQEYDDNVFLTNESQEEEFISLIVPGIYFSAAAKHIVTDIDYFLEYRFYKNEAERNLTSIEDIQNVLAHSTLFPDRDFTVEVMDEYSRVILDESRPFVEGNPLVNTATRNLLEISPRYRFRALETFQSSLEYRYRSLQYGTEGGDDTESHRFDVGLVKHLRPVLRVRGEYGVQFTDNEAAADFRRHDVYAGFEMEPTPRLALDLVGGWGWIDFQDRSGTGGLLVDAGATYTLSSRHIWRLDYRQGFAESATEGLVQDREARLTVTLNPGERISNSWGVFAREADYEEIDRNDRVAGGDQEIVFALSTHLDASLGAHFAYYRFEEDVTVEDVLRWEAAAGLTWETRLAVFRLGYRYLKNNSEFSSLDYSSNTFFGEVVIPATLEGAESAMEPGVPSSD